MHILPVYSPHTFSGLPVLDQDRPFLAAWYSSRWRIVAAITTPKFTLFSKKKVEATVENISSIYFRDCSRQTVCLVFLELFSSVSISHLLGEHNPGNRHDVKIKSNCSRFFDSHSKYQKGLTHTLLETFTVTDLASKYNRYYIITINITPNRGTAGQGSKKSLSLD